MEVFNSSGESGMAVIHMDGKQAVRLKFQYRINISIVYASQDARFDIDPSPHQLNTLQGSENEIYPPNSDVAPNTFNENLVLDFGGVTTHCHSTGGPVNDDVSSVVGESHNLLSSMQGVKTVNAPGYPALNVQGSTLESEDCSHSTTVINDPAECSRGSGDFQSQVFVAPGSNLKEAAIDKYRQVRENLNDIFRKRTTGVLDNAVCAGAKIENDTSCDQIEHEEEEEEETEMDCELDKGSGHGINVSNYESHAHEPLLITASSVATSKDSGSPHQSSKDDDDDNAHSGSPCDVCHKVFESTKAFEEHQRAPATKIKCLVCKEECLSRAHLMLHDYVAHTHQGNLSKKMNKECPVCKESSSDDSELVDHIKCKHTHEGIYKCCLCQKVFETDSDFMLHTAICRNDKNYRKFIKANMKLSTKVHRKKIVKQKAVKRKGEISESEGDSKQRVVRKRTTVASSDETSKVSNSSPTKIKITFKKQDKTTAKLKKAKLNAQYYQKLKQQRLVKKQKEAEEKVAKGGDNKGPAIVIEKGHQCVDGNDSSWNKSWKCKYCDRIFMNMREFNSHTTPMRTKRVCTKCGDRSKSKAEYLLHQCKKDSIEQGSGRGKRKCPVCEEEVPKKQILKHVMFQHTSEMPHLCCICGVPLDSYESWISHCESHHAPSSANTASENRLFSHVSYTSTNSQNNTEIICKLCKSHFCSQKDFVHHHKYETVRKACNICEMPTYTEAGYIVHRYLSHGLSPDESYSLAIPSCYDNSNNNLWEEDRFGEWRGEGQGLPCVKCPCCPDNVNTKDLLFHVMERHTGESPFKCCACEEVSPNMGHFIQHCDFHLGKRMYNNKTPRCLQCDLRFESRRSLNSHKQFHQKRCPYCQMEFSSAVFLKIHLQNYHTNDMEACSFCGKLFACSTQLAEHERHHYFSKQSQCTVCGKLIFARNMAKHMKIAHPKSDDDCFFCTVCNKRFRDRHQMEQHQLCHSTNCTHECDVCKKKFKNAIRLREHAKVHLEKKRLFVCDICGKTCTEKYNLQVHMRVHSNTKEFHCPLCNQGFNYNQSLKSHMEKEHNKMSVGPQHFNCSLCNIPFGYVHTLENHMREKHGYSTTNYGPASQWY